jgi:hypothetical protein
VTRLGSIVQWPALVRGVPSTLRGTVVEVVPAWIVGGNGAGRPVKFRVPGNAGRRTRVSYVVEVDGRTYWPRPELLEVVAVEEAA